MNSNTSSTPKTSSFTPTAQVLIAALIICLGLGNIVVGQTHYRQLIADNLEQETPLETFDEDFPLPLEADLNLESKRRRKLEHRLHFYKFVTSGGVVLVLLGSGYLLGIILLSKV